MHRLELEECQLSLNQNQKKNNRALMVLQQLFIKIRGHWGYQRWRIHPKSSGAKKSFVDRCLTAERRHKKGRFKYIFKLRTSAYFNEKEKHKIGIPSIKKLEFQILISVLEAFQLVVAFSIKIACLSEYQLFEKKIYVFKR